MASRTLMLAATCALSAVLGGCVSTKDWNSGESLLPAGGEGYAAEPSAPPSYADAGYGPREFDEAQPRRWGFLPRFGQRGAPPPVETASRSEFADIGYADWSDNEPAYRFFPGDEVEISVPSAPELNRTSIVQPDGRVSVNLVAPVMAADRSAAQLQDALTQAYSGVLLRPAVNVAVKTATPIKVFVGGEVTNPGMFDMTGDGDALRAIIQAGGFRTTAKLDRVVIIRRGPDGRAMMRTVDLRQGMRVGNGAVDLVPLRRFDIVFVPRSSIAEANLFVQQYFRDLSPIQFGFNYSLNNPYGQ